MSTSIIEKFDTLKDKRRPEGKRHKQSTIVIVTILSIVAQIYTLRGITSFVKRHKEELEKLLNLGKNGVPSYNVIRNVLQQIDFNELSIIIKKWIIEEKLIDDDEWISIDGKGIRSTITNYNSSEQNFVSIVTAFAQKSGVAILSSKFDTKKTSEIEIAELLIKAMNVKGKTFTFDALHCKKNS